MPRYDVACPNCGVNETFARMSTDLLVECPVCHSLRPKAVTDFQHVEDRTHMFQGPLGTGYSFALGEQMPDSRKKRDALAAKKGVEFVGKREFLASNKEAAEAVEYTDYVKAGGEREPFTHGPAANWQSNPAWAQPLVGKG